MVRQQSAEVLKSLAGLDEDAEALIALTAKIVQAYGGSVYMMDIYTGGAVNRALALSAGFKRHIEEFNLICAGAIVRLHLDTALRFSAAWLVSDPNDFVMKVLEGVPVRKLKDRDNKPMTDAYLVEKLSAEYPWVEQAYDHTCRYVHLSDTHLNHAFSVVERDSGPGFNVKIGREDRELPDAVYINATGTFRAATAILHHYLAGWHFSKANPEALAALKARREAT